MSFRHENPFLESEKETNPPNFKFLDLLVLNRIVNIVE